MEEYDHFDYIKGESEENNGLYINGIKYSFSISKLDYDKESFIIKLYDSNNESKVIYIYKGDMTTIKKDIQFLEFCEDLDDIITNLNDLFINGHFQFEENNGEYYLIFKLIESETSESSNIRLIKLDKENEEKFILEDKINKLENDYKELYNKYEELKIINEKETSYKNKLVKDNISLNNENKEIKINLEQFKTNLIQKDKELSNIKFKNKGDNNEISKLKERIKELENQLEEEKTNKEIDNEELKQRLSLIEGIINYGVDSNTQNDSYNNPGNKCLLIDLVASTYPNISQNRDTNFLQSGNVAAAMLEIDRKDFAPTNPYQNRPQSINYNVTISAPHMHALALEYLAPYCTENSKILDIGSGSAYLTCALSALTNYQGTVIGVEHIEQLINFGINNIKKNHENLLNNKKIIIVKGDGRKGCKKYGPYKAIHVGAAVEEVPEELFNQLDKNGRMFIPVGKNGEQKICLFDKDKFGNITKTELLSVCYGLLTDPNSQLNPKY